MNTAASRFQVVEAIYQRALDQPPERRTEFLARECRGDESLRREIEVLLDHYRAAQDSFLNTPAHAMPPPLDAPPLPDRVGAFRVLGKLGEGGMGIVYRAEQQRPKREVAIKVLRPGVTSLESLRRFEFEAALLGRLKHPGIAQVFEVGTHEEGGHRQPFFALELVEGSPLIAFASARQLDVRARLKLFDRVCDAVQHAHQKGVIHRDLKPANILVDAAGQPKILDFGVARTTDSDVRVTTMHTHQGQVIGTLPYMSPEQVASNVGEIDARADVYALGVILYELLAGRVPHDVTGKSIPAAARVITETEPEALATINRTCHGDLNTIVMKALEKDPARRYPAVSDLSADLRRYLHHEPIAARPATTFYQLRKFAGRHRAAVIGAASIVVLLAASSAALGLLYHRESQARAAETQARRTAETVIAFLNRDLLTSVDPHELGRDVKMLDVLDRANQSLESRFLDDPVVRGLILTALGDAYAAIGELDRAESILSDAVTWLEPRVSKHAVELLKARHSLANAWTEQGHYDRSINALTGIIASETKVLGRDDPTTRTSRILLASTYLYAQRPADALPIYGELLAAHRGESGEQAEETLSCLNGVARAHDDLGHVDEAERLYRQAWELSTKTRGVDHPGTLAFAHNLGLAMHELGRLDDADEILSPTHQHAVRRCGDDHPTTLKLLSALARLREDQLRLSEAEELYQRLVEAWSRTLGPNHRSTLITRNDLALVAMRRGALEQAIALWEPLIDTEREVFGPDDPMVLSTQTNLANAYLDLGRPTEAETLHRRILSDRIRVLGDRHPQTMSARINYASALIELGRNEEAEPLVVEALNFATQTYPEGHKVRVGARGVFGRCMLGLRRWNEAEPALLAAHQVVESEYGRDHPRTQRLIRALVEMYVARQDAANAASWQARLAPNVPPTPNQ